MQPNILKQISMLPAIVAGGLMVAAVPAAAQETLPLGGRIFQMADRNGDGVVDAAERTAGRTRLFALVDLNADGTVTLDEIAELRECRARMVERIQARMFARNDLDNSGGVTLAEFQTAGERRLAVIDANGDGLLSLDELPVFPGAGCPG